jgi:hypothetical protein
MQAAVAAQHGQHLAVKVAKVVAELVEHQTQDQVLTEQVKLVLLTEVAVQVQLLELVK